MVARLHLPHSKVVRLHARKSNVVILTAGVWSEMETRDWKTWINDFTRIDIVGCKPYWVVLTITRHIGGSYSEAFLHSSPYSTAENVEQYHFVSIRVNIPTNPVCK